MVLGDIRDVGLIPELGRSPGEGRVNPIHYSCLEKPMDRGAWRATVHKVAKSRTRLKRLSTQPSTCASDASSSLSFLSWIYRILVIPTSLSLLWNVKCLHLKIVKIKWNSECKGTSKGRKGLCVCVCVCVCVYEPGLANLGLEKPGLMVLPWGWGLLPEEVGFWRVWGRHRPERQNARLHMASRAASDR